jgi:hypothetical protein
VHLILSDSTRTASKASVLIEINRKMFNVDSAINMHGAVLYDASPQF